MLIAVKVLIVVAAVVAVTCAVREGAALILRPIPPRT